MKFSLYYLPTYDPEQHGSERGLFDQMIGSGDLLFDERTLFGSPARGIAKIRELEAIGVTEIGLKIDQPAMPRTQIMESLDLFVREVLPAFTGH